jgi:hypothetical protein
VALANLDLFDHLRDEVAADDVRNSDERGALDELAADLGLEIDLRIYPKNPPPADPPVGFGIGRERATGVGRALEMMENWRGLFSPTGEPYRSLDRTLMRMPGGVPCRSVPYIKLVRLREPVPSRLGLATLALYEKERLRRGIRRRNEAVFLSAPPDRIARAARLVGEHIRSSLRTRTTEDLAFLVRFLMDYPDDHDGNIVGLAEKSVRWHREAAHREAERIAERLGGVHETAPPPIPLPREPEIRFLSTVGDLCAEGEHMRNCVATYAEMAVRGGCYVFHASRRGEEATVEVDRAGRVVQASGPRNTGNSTSRWAERALNRWGRTFPEGHDRVVAGTRGRVRAHHDFGDVPFWAKRQARPRKPGCEPSAVGCRTSASRRREFGETS